MDPVEPSTGTGVVHLFYRAHPGVDTAAIGETVDKLVADGGQVVPVSILGHKADLAFMALHSDLRMLRRFQTGIARSGLELVDSYVSLTELSEYSQDVPEKMQQMRLFPQLPPPGKPAWCFYPMSKRRNVEQNWYAQPYDERHRLMMEHGMSGRKFAGRILQVVTGSTGIDDFEWGVTLFGTHPDDLKEVVYTMRYDEASAIYGEFGAFYTGITDTLDVVLDELGLS